MIIQRISSFISAHPEQAIFVMKTIFSGLLFLSLDNSCPKDQGTVIKMTMPLTMMR